MAPSVGLDVPRESGHDFGQETESRGGVFFFAQRCQVLCGDWEDIDRVSRFKRVLRVIELIPCCATPEERAVVATLVHEIGDRVLRAFCGRLLTVVDRGPAARVFQPMAGLVAAALTAIAARYAEADLRLAAIAANVGVSRWALSRALNRGLGRDFAECVNGFRVLRAATLLRATKLSVKEIAAEAGCGWTKKLDRHFQAYLHMTPVEFRTAPRIQAR